jgi:hypothetical protein
MKARIVLAVAGLCAVAALAACGEGGEPPANETAAPAPATGMRRFVNSRDNARTVALRDNYTDFSFDYPAGWSVTPQPVDGTAQNYVRVAAPMIDGYEPFAVHVGFASGTGDAEADRRTIQSGMRAFAHQYGSSFEDYRIVSVGPDRVGAHASHGWRFTAVARAVGGGAPVQIYGRGDIVLPPGATRGVAIITLATSRTDEVTSAGQVGETGQLKALYESFRLTGVAGTPQPPPPPVARLPDDDRAYPAPAPPSPTTAPAPVSAERPAPAPAAPIPAPPAPPAAAPVPRPTPSPPPTAPQPQPPSNMTDGNSQ